MSNYWVEQGTTKQGFNATGENAESSENTSWTLETSRLKKCNGFSTVDDTVSDDEGEIFIDESDLINEVMLDDEDLPDVDDDDDDDDDDDELALQDDSIHIFRGHTGPLYAVACSPTDPMLVASGSEDEKALFWRIGQGDCRNELVGHQDTISSLAFSTDGHFLASGGVDACVKIWDMSGNLKCTFGGPAESFELEWVRWHPSAHLVLGGCTDATVRLWNADKGACLGVFYGHGETVTCGDFTPNGKTICTGSVDGTLRTWNPRSGENTLVRGYPYNSSPITCLTMTLDSTLVLTGSDDGVLKIANITIGKVVCSSPSHSAPIRCIGLSSSARWVATGGADQKLVVWDVDRAECRSICEHEDEVTCLKWLGESKYVASGCQNGQIIIWDSRSGDPATTFSGHSGQIHELSVSADQRFLVSASDDGVARVFDISKFT